MFDENLASGIEKSGQSRLPIGTSKSRSSLLNPIPLERNLDLRCVLWSDMSNFKVIAFSKSREELQNVYPYRAFIATKNK
jgi:hypothetical protein